MGSAKALAARCGRLLVVGVSGPVPTRAERDLFAAGARGGVILFRRNTTADPESVAALVEALHRATPPSEPPPLVSIDQEGGRFVNLGPPLLDLPPMARLGVRGDAELLRRVAAAQARELAALGIALSYAPVVDVHSRPENPIIGDRAFATTPEEVVRLAGAFADGLAEGGVLACAKHFPGHGDTTLDSHVALPTVDRDRAALDAVELRPFRELAARVPTMMTAHVVYPALDDRPATVSRRIATDLLRGELGFRGVLFSDDLEMKALTGAMGDVAVAAVAAGCDALLVCASADRAAEAHAGLVVEAERSPAFRARVEEAEARLAALRRRIPPFAFDPAALAAALRASAPIAQALRDGAR